MPQLTYLEAIRQGIWEEMERDPTVFCLGEDIGIYGGAFKVTDGFIDRFGPERVIDTPIAESAIVGAAFGASLTGMRPVAEFQFMDFIGCAFNQIVNMVAKAHYRWGAPAPLVIRGPSGGNVHGGPFHSQNPEMWFVHAPGLKVVCPASAYDAKGLIKAAIRDNNPVIFFEHKYLYRRIKEEVPAEDYIVPLGKARIAREGRDLSIITYAAMVHTALEAAETLKQGRDRRRNRGLAHPLAPRSRGHCSRPCARPTKSSFCTSTRAPEASPAKLRPSSTKKLSTISMAPSSASPRRILRCRFLRRRRNISCPRSATWCEKRGD